MPKLSKDAFSRYLRTECDRQLRLLLATDEERASSGMPEEQPPRPGLAVITEQGLQWQHEKVTDLGVVFGAGSLLADPRPTSKGLTKYGPLDLDASLTEATAKVGSATAPVWIVEPEYPVGLAFESALSIQGLRSAHALTYANLRPDLVEVIPSGTEETQVLPDGTLTPLPPTDQRLRLRVIDVKLTAEASVPYLSEATLYSMTLASWLVDKGRDTEFVVVDSAAIWPGSHEASALVAFQEEATAEGRAPDLRELHTAMAEDLELVPFDVFAPRVRGFFQEDVPRVLQAPWRDLPWHVATPCRSCPFLGVKSWKNAKGEYTWKTGHCIPMAEASGHLSRVPDVSRGARAALERGGVSKIADLAARAPEDPLLDEHQRLRAGRTVITKRAEVLDRKSEPLIAPTSGTSATMPKWANLRIEISTDFDPGSAISFSFAVQAFWLEPRPFGQPPGRQKLWKTTVFIVDERKTSVEEREFLNFLNHLHSILLWANQENPDTTVQFYVWDELETKQLSRVVGRHLAAILSSPDVKDLAWLFPSEELLPNAKFATRRSPLTAVRNVVRATVAAPIAHYYSLLELAREFHEEGLPPNIATFSTHPLFEDPLSDQVPPERAHEIWTRSQVPYWGTQMAVLRETVQKRLRALATVRRRLEEDLAGLAQTAPKIRIGALEPAGKMAFDSELWLAFSRLEEAMAELEADQIRAMPPHEREAKFSSARLEKRLTGEEEKQVLSRLGLGASPDRRVYRLEPKSSEVKIRDGDIGFALAPETAPGFLDLGLNFVLRGASLEEVPDAWRTRMADIMKVRIVAMDRDKREVVVDLDRFKANRLKRPQLVEELEGAGAMQLGADVMLDPVHTDFLTKKLKDALQAIGNPKIAKAADIRVKTATGSGGRRGAKASPVTPPAEFLWDGERMHSENVPRNLASTRSQLEESGLIQLNLSQWSAWEGALSRRLQLIWGPPGTGKSQTLRGVVLGAAVHANQNQEGLRVLVTATTYTAIDNVLLELNRMLEQELAGADLQVARIRSGLQGPAIGWPEGVDLELNRFEPSPEIDSLKQRLLAKTGVTVVSATPQQVSNLLRTEPGSPQQELFDLVVFDEASQTDVPHAVLSLASLAAAGAVVLAGDPLQLPPIHRAEPPIGLEAMVGSIYEFVEKRHGVESAPLLENYRSNDDLVSFARRGGYLPSLRSVSPELRLSMSALEPAQPEGWPSDLLWTSAWDELLEPNDPSVAFVYEDHAWSSQWNQFEADAVASLVWRLRNRMQAELLNEVDPSTGQPKPAQAPKAITDDEFWTVGVGIVTPHRAQQALVVSALKKVFPAIDPELIRDAVDTVERFQGQERDVIIATFALGDPDAISDEDEFLLAFNRFNVVASRARAKLIVLVSEQVIDHLSEDIEVLRESRLLKLYANAFCDKERPMTLGHLPSGQRQDVQGAFRSH